MRLRTIIVEDEPLSRQYIRSLLKRFPEVDLLAEATTQEDAIHLIEQLNPDLIFLDIELHTGTGLKC
jgi:DNA-binding NarL/FixJ family response regulator